MQHLPEGDQQLMVVGLDVERALQQLLGLCTLGAIPGEQTEPVQGKCVAGLVSQHLPKADLRLRKPLSLQQLRSELQQL